MVIVDYFNNFLYEFLILQLAIFYFKNTKVCVLFTLIKQVARY